MVKTEVTPVLAISNQPSHSVLAEQAVLGAVLIKPSMLPRLLATLKPEDFFVPQHFEIWESMENVHKRGRPVDVLTLADDLKARGMLNRLEGEEAYLLTVANVTPTAENVEHYANLVRSHASTRQLEAVCRMVISRCREAPEEVGELITRAQRHITEITVGRTGISETFAQTGERVMDEIERAAKGETVSRVLTGIVRLDNIIHGLYPGLIVPEGLTGRGKSSLAFQIAGRAAADRQVPALIFALELNRAQVFSKIAANLARTGSSDFDPRPSNPNSKVENDRWTRIDYAVGKAAKLTDLIRVEECRNIEQILSIAMAWRSAHPGPQALVVVDHIQKVYARQVKGANREQEVASVVKALKDLSTDLKCPVIAPSQMDNDAAKDNRPPRLGDARESKAIEHEADMVIGIHRDGTSVEPRVPCELIVLKNRFGRMGTKACVEWVGSWQGFEHPEEDSFSAPYAD